MEKDCTHRSLECRGGAAAADRDRKAVYLFSYSIANESSGFIPSRASRNPPGSQAGLPRHMALVEWRIPGMPRIDLARVTDFNQPAFDNVRHKRYHKRLPVSRNGPE